VPSTYKQKKTAVQAPPKVEGDEEAKPAATGEVATEEGETPAPMGRGAR